LVIAATARAPAHLLRGVDGVGIAAPVRPMNSCPCARPLTAPALAAGKTLRPAALKETQIMTRVLSIALLFTCLAGCAVTSAVGAVVETGATVAKTGVKAGGAVADGAIDAVDEDEDPDEESEKK
jgi:hypothetical protein